MRDRLRELRAIAGGLSQRELSLLAGLNGSHVGLIEQGRVTEPGGATMAKLAEVFGVSLDWLVLGVGAAPRPEQVVASVEAARARLAGSDSSPVATEPAKVSA